ncbi:hypothetical protein LCGC14_1622260 [marine sediment metagenome]|uniref:Uncharacterized protein n=1 Tax=marine sediment metagenome TaxID=412755 RepID=A0A0F9IS59_9ZZZZ
MSTGSQRDTIETDKDRESEIWWLREELQFLEKSLVKIEIEYNQVLNKAAILRDQIKQIGDKNDEKTKAESK